MLPVTDNEQISRAIEVLTGEEINLTPRQFKRAAALILLGVSGDEAIQVCRLPPRQYKQFVTRRLPKPQPDEAAKLKDILTVCLRAIDSIISPMPDQERAKWVERVRYPLHNLVDEAIKLSESKPTDDKERVEEPESSPS